jgi:aminodeoxyfutalosine deaminase
VILRARIVVPVTAPPLEDGAVLISGGRIAAIGRWADLRRVAPGPVHDLGECVLMPGWINAHCHLDYTHLAGQLAPTRNFTEWIKSIHAAKSAWGFSEFALSWIDGARQLIESGTTSVANIESIPELLPQCLEATPLRVWSFLELTALRPRLSPAQLVEDAAAWLQRLPEGPGGRGLSPHAPYSTTPGLLSATASTASRHGWPVTIHLAESDAEFEMFMYRRGPMHDWLATQRPMEDCGLGSPVQALERSGLLSPGLVAVHVNRLWHDDARLLGERGVTVVHCPQSHSYFHHARFPRPELDAAGVRVCLGTDSLASTHRPRGIRPLLSLFDEVRALLQTDALLEPQRVLEMVTLHGAHALRQSGNLGELIPGARADFAAIPYSGELSTAVESILHHEGPVAGTWINGRLVFRHQLEAPPMTP